MSFDQMSIIAGTISSLMFAGGTLPMLIKAHKTHNLGSYSFSSIAMNVCGNAIHWVYIAGLPMGPIWFLHTFYTVSTILMLAWYVRYSHA